jgi:hypothetical protein
MLPQRKLKSYTKSTGKQRPLRRAPVVAPMWPTCHACGNRADMTGLCRDCAVEHAHLMRQTVGVRR